MFKPNAIDIIKDNVTITDILNRYGFTPNRAGFIVCPFHTEKTASMKIYTKTNTYKCFGGCGAYGGVIDWVMNRENVPTTEAMDLIAEWMGLDIWMDGTADEATKKKADQIRAQREKEREAIKIREEFIADILKEIRCLRRDNRKFTETLNEAGRKSITENDEKMLDFLIQLSKQAWANKTWMDYLWDTLRGLDNNDSRYAHTITRDRTELARKLYSGALNTRFAPF